MVMEAAPTLITNGDKSTLLRAVLLHDKTGRVQAILPADNMLDLKALKDETGRDLVMVGHQEMEELYDSERLTGLEQFPQLNNVTTIIDSSVVQAELHFLSQSQCGNADKSISHAALQKALLEFDHDLLEMQISIPPDQLIEDTPDALPDEDQIVSSLKNFTSLRIKQRLEDTLEIPTLPHTAQRIIQLRVNPNAAMDELTQIVESVPSLAAQVVSWAASPYYAAPGKIRSVQDAIVRVLGFDLVGNLALGLALGKTLEVPKDSAEGITPYWLQSIYCSTLVEAIVRLVPNELKPSKGLVYLAGLLHNFGYLVLAHIFPPHFSQICRYMEANPHISHMAIERHLLQITREQICVWLMQLWNMPDEIPIAIRHQHNPEYDGKHCAYPNLTFMALRLLREQGIGDAPLEKIPDSLYARYELDPEEVAAKVQQVIDSSDKIGAMASNFPS